MNKKHTVREKHDSGGSRLTLILKSHVTESTCHLTHTPNIRVLMVAFIALNILCYFSTNIKCNKKNSMMCEMAHCPYQESITEAAGHFWLNTEGRQPTPLHPHPARPRRWSAVCRTQVGCGLWAVGAGVGAGP